MKKSDEQRRQKSQRKRAQIEGPSEFAALTVNT